MSQSISPFPVNVNGMDVINGLAVSRGNQSSSDIAPFILGSPCCRVVFGISSSYLAGRTSGRSATVRANSCFKLSPHLIQCTAAVAVRVSPT